MRKRMIMITIRIARSAIFRCYIINIATAILKSRYYEEEIKKKRKRTKQTKTRSWRSRWSTCLVDTIWTAERNHAREDKRHPCQRTRDLAVNAIALHLVNGQRIVNISIPSRPGLQFVPFPARNRATPFSCLPFPHPPLLSPRNARTS